MLRRVFTDKRLSQECFNASEHEGIVFADQTDGGSVCASSTCASDAMNIVLGVLWQVVIDDVSDVVHMDTPACDIGSDEDL